jgi:hypothetical protein
MIKYEKYGDYSQGFGPEKINSLLFISHCLDRSGLFYISSGLNDKISIKSEDHAEPDQ